MLALGHLAAMEIDAWKDGYRSFDAVPKCLQRKAYRCCAPIDACVEPCADVLNQFRAFTGKHRDQHGFASGGKTGGVIHSFPGTMVAR